MKIMTNNKWKHSVLSEISLLIKDGTHGTHKNIADGIPLLSAKDIHDGIIDTNNNPRRISNTDYKTIHKKYEIKKHDILLTIVGTIGRCAIVKDVANKFTVQRSVAVLRMNDSVIPEYVYQIFLSNQFQKDLTQGAHGLAQAGIYLGELSKKQIPVPPLKTQQKISDILSSIDEAIQKTDQIIRKSERLKYGLMQNIFSFQNKEEVKFIALGDIGKVSMCRRIFKEETSSIGEIPFYKIGTFGKEPDAFISQELYDSYRKKFSFPKIGDVLLSASGTIGRRVQFDGKPAYFQDSNIIWLEHDESIVLNNFLFYLYETIKWQTEGSTIKRLYNNIILKKRVPVPSIDNQRKIVKILSVLDEKISINKKSKIRLNYFKKGIMQDIFSQKVEVNSYE